MTKTLVDELKSISDDKNYNEMYAVSSLTRLDRTIMLFEDYRTFKIHHIGYVNCLVLRCVSLSLDKGLYIKSHGSCSGRIGYQNAN